MSLPPAASWVEQGGPPVSPPQRSGLGTLILTRLAEQSLDAKVEMDFADGGLRWRLRGSRHRRITNGTPKWTRPMA